MTKLVINLDELDLRELLEARHQCVCNVVQCAIRLAAAHQIDMQAAIDKLQSAVAGKTVVDQRQTLVALHVAGTFEEFIEHRIDNVL